LLTCRFEELAAAHASWQSLLADPSVRRCFLSTPVEGLGGRYKFTEPQLR
jgi:hypothetical protein